MTYSAEQITFMLAEAIDKDKEYKSWHVSTKHLMTLVQMVIEKEALAQPEQEPVAWIWEKEDGYIFIETHNLDDEDMKNVGVKSIKPLYTTPPQRTWVGLTDADKESFWTGDQMSSKEWDELYAEVEAKLKEKNNG